jgi:protein-ribulosamine 3-kinase
MRLFGGFGADFFAEYHKIVPKSVPVEDYEDRINLYIIYHLLNHQALFGGRGYKNNALERMMGLIQKYGESSSDRFI